MLYDVHGWNPNNGDIVKVWFTTHGNLEDGLFTVAMVLTDDGRVWQGAAKQHEEDPYNERIGKKLALQRAQPVADVRELRKTMKYGALPLDWL